MLVGGQGIMLWDVQKCKLIRTFPEDSVDIKSIAFSPEGKYFLIGGQQTFFEQDQMKSKGKLKLWDISTGKLVNSFHGDYGWVWSIAFSPDSRFAISGGWKGAFLWNIPGGKLLKTIDLPNSNWVRSASFSPDGEYLALGWGDGSISLLEVST